MSENPEATLRYYGISPWEIEVLYGYLNFNFTVVQDEIEPNDDAFVSFLEMEVPLAFNDAFFEWFGFRRWEKVKAIFKEIKRRRGSNHALKIRIIFGGTPRIVFTIDTEDKQWFDNAMEKIDFVLELLPYHLDPKKLPAGITEIRYMFDPKSIRWRLGEASSKHKRYSFGDDSWKDTT